MRAAAAALRFLQVTRLTGLAGLVGLGRAARLAPAIAPSPFVASGQRFEAPSQRGLAFLHVGCIMGIAFPGVHRATVRLLQRGGISVVAPRGQGCCGAIALHDGDPDFARELAKRNIEAFERSEADVYVVNAAGCGSALKDYADLFAEDPQWRERARNFTARVRDATEVLDALDLGEAAGSVDAAVTYQDACHLVHAQRVAGAPRRLLKRIPGLRLVEMEESALCCGSAGTYNLTHPAMADRLARRKIDAISRTGATIVATANPGCAMQIAAALRDVRGRVAVKHVVELLDDVYR
ncbi:MAG TPA: (Fe-S)-binding protein [Candidatus Cybelea sp.]|nr:(Fe-S)-binding protein [Candidatus Cybelea sp.]